MIQLINLLMAVHESVLANGHGLLVQGWSSTILGTPLTSNKRRVLAHRDLLLIG